MYYNPYQLDILARTILGEAAGEDELGMEAVAHTILNRTRDSRWPGDPAAVALQPKQFSAWNKGEGGNKLVDIGPGDPRYEKAKRIAQKVLTGGSKDPTGGATHYYAPQGMPGGASPNWWNEEVARRGGQPIEIGNHRFAGIATGAPEQFQGNDMPMQINGPNQSTPTYQPGFLQGAGGDILQALGLSMMSSPRNHMLRDFGQNYTKMQQETKSAEGLFQALVSAGMDEKQAAALARNPIAAKFALSDLQQRRELNAQQQQMAQARSLFGSRPTSVSQAPASVDSGSPGNRTYATVSAELDKLYAEKDAALQAMETGVGNEYADKVGSARLKRIDSQIKRAEKQIERFAPTTLRKNLSDLQKLREEGAITDDEFNAKRGQLLATKGQEAIEVFGPDGNMIVRIGGDSKSTLGKPATSELEKSIEGSLKMLDTTARIADSYSDNFLTYVGRAEAALAAAADKAGLSSDKQKELLTQRTKFRTNVEQLFNDYRREITGAAASVQELTVLKNAILNSDMGPTEFRSAYEDFVDKIRRGLETKRKLLDGGLNPRDPMFWVEWRKLSVGESALPEQNSGNAPEGVDPSDWQYMTPEERALWN